MPERNSVFGLTTPSSTSTQSPGYHLVTKPYVVPQLDPTMTTPGSHPPRLALLLVTLLLLFVLAESNGTEARESRRHRNTKPRIHTKEPQPTQHSQDNIPSFTKNASKLPPRAQHKTPGRKPRSEKPNIVFILTDDQDVLLGKFESYIKNMQSYFKKYLKCVVL